jgi:hypothetical protein
MSDSQLMELHKAEIEKRDTARAQARSDIKDVQVAVTKADLEKCRNILRKRTDYRVDSPLRPDTKYTCATKRGKNWFSSERPVTAAYVTWVKRADATTRTIYKKRAYCVFEIKGGRVVKVTGKVGGKWLHVRSACHSI